MNPPRVHGCQTSRPPPPQPRALMPETVHAPGPRTALYSGNQPGVSIIQMAAPVRGRTKLGLVAAGRCIPQRQEPNSPADRARWLAGPLPRPDRGKGREKETCEKARNRLAILPPVSLSATGFSKRTRTRCPPGRPRARTLLHRRPPGHVGRVGANVRAEESRPTPYSAAWGVPPL